MFGARVESEKAQVVQALDLYLLTSRPHKAQSMYGQISPVQAADHKGVTTSWRCHFFDEQNTQVAARKLGQNRI